MREPKHIPGIYQFIKENKQLVIKELTESIPYDSITNYRKWEVFDIVDEDGHWRIQTGENTKGYPRSSQGHCDVWSNDIVYCNRTAWKSDKNVSDVVISTYNIFLRDNKIDNILN